MRSQRLVTMKTSPSCRLRAVALFVGINLIFAFTPAFSQSPAETIVLNDDGAWSWFEDEREIVHDGKLIVGSVASGTHDPARRGDVEVLTYDLATGRKTLSELHDRLQHDDHNSPALLSRPDGRILAVYARHGPENRFYYRISEQANDATRWGQERTFSPSESLRITYSNLHYLSRENGGKGRLFNFYRGLDNHFKPSYATSDQGGRNWTSGNVFIDVPSRFRHRPYVKYTSNGAANELHPVGLSIPFSASPRDEYLPSSGRRLANRGHSPRRRPAAGGRAVVRYQLRVRHDQTNLLRRDSHLLRGSLGNLSARPLSDLHFAGQDGHGSVFRDVEPGGQSDGFPATALPRRNLDHCGNQQSRTRDFKEMPPVQLKPVTRLLSQLGPFGFEHLVCVEVFTHRYSPRRLWVGEYFWRPAARPPES